MNPMSEVSPKQAPRGLDATVLVGGLLTLAAGFAFFWVLTSEPPLEPEADHPFAFAPLEIDEEKLERQRKAKFGRAREALDRAELGSFFDLVRELNRGQFPPDDASEQRDLGRTLAYRAENIIESTGYDAFVAAGEPLFEDCLEGVDRLLEAVRSGALEIEQARDEPPASEFEGYRDSCGNFLPTLLDRRLVEDSGAWASPEDRSRILADLLQRLRWASLNRNTRRPLVQLTDYGRRILMRWRIESEAYPVQKRLEYLAELDEDPGLVDDYDSTLARAKLAYLVQGPQPAAEILTEALEQSDSDHPDYRRRLDWLRDQRSD